MIWLLIPIIYFAVAVWFWRRFAWQVAHKEARAWSHSGYLDNGNISMGIGLGGAQALVWPVVLFLTKSDALEWFLKEPGSTRRKRELDEREARIAALEREVGIK